ncbi:hypothetical protein NKH98_17725 [Mesorhizobium sp. M0833]|uniref:hypothetical protein n=1 Tax=Mesorhizobium sp. M0833 TaxID=2957009 RepID=UPI00333D69CE
MNGFFVIFAVRLAFGLEKVHKGCTCNALASRDDRPECENTLFGLTTAKLLGARIMADSDNSTPLSFVTRRQLLPPEASTSGSQLEAVATRKELERDQATDPAVAVWRKWQAAHEETERLSREQQRLERKLTETVGFPNVMIQLSDGRTATLRSLEALRDVLRVGSVDVTVGAKAEADLAAHQARWDVSDRAIGYSATLRAESEAADRAEVLLEALSETPAISLAGVAAKLDAILREGQPSKDDAEFPWPQIRSVLEDIRRIDGQTEPS